MIAIAGLAGSRLCGIDPTQISTMCGCIERLMYMFAGKKHTIVNRFQKHLA